MLQTNVKIVVFVFIFFINVENREHNMFNEGPYNSQRGQQKVENFDLSDAATVYMRDNFITFVNPDTGENEFRLSVSPAGELVEEKYDTGSGSFLPPQSLTPGTGPTTSKTLPHDIMADYIEITSSLFEVMIASEQLLRIDPNGDLFISDLMEFRNTADAVLRARASGGEALRIIDQLTSNQLLSISDVSLDVHTRPILNVQASADPTSAVTLAQLNAATSEPENLKFNAGLNNSRVLNLADAPVFTFTDSIHTSTAKLQYDSAKALTADRDLTDVGYVTTALADYQETAEKGAANGYASLDGAGTIPIAEIPTIPSLIEPYEGLDASKTNSGTYPSTPPIGTLFLATDTQVTYVLNAADETVPGNWLQLEPSSTVASVNTKTGVVLLNTDDIGETATNMYFSSGMSDYLTTFANEPVNLLRLNASGTINPAQFSSELLLGSAGVVNIFDNGSNSLEFRDNSDDSVLMTVGLSGVTFGSVASYTSTPALGADLNIPHKRFVDDKAFLRNSGQTTFLNLTAANEIQFDISSSIVFDATASRILTTVPLRYSGVTVSDAQDLTEKAYVDAADSNLQTQITNISTNVLANTNLSAVRPDELNSGVSNAVLAYNSTFSEAVFDANVNNLVSVAYRYPIMGKFDNTAGSNSYIECAGGTIAAYTDDGAGVFSKIMEIEDTRVALEKSLEFTAGAANAQISDVTLVQFDAGSSSVTASYGIDDAMPKKAIAQYISELGGGGGGTPALIASAADNTERLEISGTTTTSKLALDMYEANAASTLEVLAVEADTGDSNTLKTTFKNNNYPKIDASVGDITTRISSDEKLVVNAEYLDEFVAPKILDLRVTNQEGGDPTVVEGQTFTITHNFGVPLSQLNIKFYLKIIAATGNFVVGDLVDIVNLVYSGNTGFTMFGVSVSSHPTIDNNNEFIGIITTNSGAGAEGSWLNVPEPQPTLTPTNTVSGIPNAAADLFVTITNMAGNELIGANIPSISTGAGTSYNGFEVKESMDSLVVEEDTITSDYPIEVKASSATQRDILTKADLYQFMDPTGSVFFDVSNANNMRVNTELSLFNGATETIRLDHVNSEITAETFTTALPSSKNYKDYQYVKDTPCSGDFPRLATFTYKPELEAEFGLSAGEHLGYILEDCTNMCTSVYTERQLKSKTTGENVEFKYLEPDKVHLFVTDKLVEYVEVLREHQNLESPVPETSITSVDLSNIAADFWPTLSQFEAANDPGSEYVGYVNDVNLCANLPEAVNSDSSINEITVMKMLIQKLRDDVVELQEQIVNIGI